MLILLALLQSAEPSGIPWPTIGAGGGPTAVSGVLLWLLRQQSTERAAERVAAEGRAAAERKASEERYAELAKDFREIVENNTAVITRLLEQDQRPARKGSHGD